MGKVGNILLILELLSSYLLPGGRMRFVGRARRIARRNEERRRRRRRGEEKETG